MKPITVAKMNNKIVEILRVARVVEFSDELGWVCICHDINDVNSSAVRWVRLKDQYFEWVREFNRI